MKKETKLDLILEPQGGYKLKFSWGFECGEQQTPSIGLWSWTPEIKRYEPFGVFTHKEVDLLILYLQHKQKRFKRVVLGGAQNKQKVKI